jgi:hypothetical protein
MEKTMSKHSEADRAYYKLVIEQTDCPRCKQSKGKGCLTTGTPQRPIYPPHEPRRNLLKRGSSGMIVEGTTTGRLPSSEPAESNTPKEEAVPPKPIRGSAKMQVLPSAAYVDKKGSDPIFKKYEGVSRIGEARVHLCKREDQRIDALCNSIIGHGFARIPGENPDALFMVCIDCVKAASDNKPKGK